MIETEKQLRKIELDAHKTNAWDTIAELCATVRALLEVANATERTFNGYGCCFCCTCDDATPCERRTFKRMLDKLPDALLTRNGSGLPASRETRP